MASSDRSFRPEDTVFLAYLVGISVFVTLFHKGVDQWWIFALTHSLAAGLLVLALRQVPWEKNGALRFLRYWYIPLFLILFYEQIDSFILGMHGRYLDHLIAVAGEDCPAIGTDYDGAIIPPPDMPNPMSMPRLVDAMLRRGYGEERVRKILGGNALRVIRARRG